MTPQSPNEALQPEAPPPPPPKPPSRRRPTLSALSGFLSLLVLVAFGALAVLAYISNKLQEPGPLASDKVIYIATHTELPDIIDKLESEGVIDSPFLLNAELTVERKRGKLKAGEYLFKQHVSLRSVIDLLVSGKQILHPITIPEGLTSAQVVQRLRDNDILVGEVRVLPKEGSILPETYKVARGTTRAEVINKMEQDDRRVVEQIWARRAPDLPLQSPYELITLASIVEKETGKADERPRVAGVFINRLRRHMRLQSDPTIVYGLVAGQGTLGHSITRSELDKRTAYNTYQIDGLPPGPIDNPGRAALEAVANPSRTSDLYFVADGTGGHVFADTIEAHNRNVQHWRQIEREAKDKVDVDKLAPSAVAPGPRTNQRSEGRSAGENNVFGALPKSVTPISQGRVASFSDPAANHDLALADDKGASANAKGHGRERKPARPVDLTAMTTSLDQMGFSISGAQPSASDLLDGPVSAPEAGGPASPVPRARGSSPPGSALAYAPEDGARSKPNPRAGHAALDAMPGYGHADLFADPKGGEALPTPTKTPPEHPRIYDVSEGTPLDPLKTKNYDLNSGKTIPDEFGTH